MGCGSANRNPNSGPSLARNYKFMLGTQKLLNGIIVGESTEMTTEKIINESNPIFKEDILAYGDESGNVQPWIVNIVPPEKELLESKYPIPVDVKIKHVFGFRAYDGHQNIGFINDDHIAYINGAVGIIHKLENNTQKIFGGLEWESPGVCHDEGIVSMAIHKGEVSMVATGQSDLNPSIIIWSPFDPSVVYSVFHQGTGTRGVTHLKFDKKGEYVASVGLDPNHTFFVFSLDTKSLFWKAQLGPNTISALQFNPLGNEFCIVGDKTVVFLYLSRKLKKEALIKNSKYANTILTTVTYNQEGTCFTGTSTGSVLIWIECLVIKEITITNFSLFYLCFDDVSKDFYAYDIEKNIYTITYKKSKQKLYVKEKFTLPNEIVCFDINSKGEMLIGMADGTAIIKKGKQEKIVIQSHSTGKVRGLEFVPEDYILTTGEDNKIFLWNITKNVCEGFAWISEKSDKKVITKMMFKMNPYSPEECSQCVSYNKDMDHVAIGMNSGYISIRRGIKKLYEKYLDDIKIGKGQVLEVKYSPDMKLLAVSTSSKEFFVLDIRTAYSVTYKMKGFEDCIIELDWDTTSKFLQTVTHDNNYLFFDMEKGELIRDPMETRSLKWNNHTCKFGYCVQGIFKGCTDPNYINSVSISNSKTIIASGDDDNFLNIYNYPCIRDNPEVKKYTGHSDQLSRVLFTTFDDKIISIASQDTSVIVWSLK